MTFCISSCRVYAPLSVFYGEEWPAISHVKTSQLMSVIHLFATKQRQCGILFFWGGGAWPLVAPGPAAILHAQTIDDEPFPISAAGVWPALVQPTGRP